MYAEDSTRCRIYIHTLIATVNKFANNHAHHRISSFIVTARFSTISNNYQQVNMDATLAGTILVFSHLYTADGDGAL